ncbi:MAG TPA: glycogen debranching protein GlgX [Acetobacteraceae bacterium]|nr:glycogen debranching protein GlgX [Acetobacteraceae bacterium]
MSPDQRIDYYPTREVAGYRVRPGRPLPFGAWLGPSGVNFSVFSNNATACTLVLFERHERTPKAEIDLPEEFRVGNVWSVMVFDLDAENIEYAFRMDGPFDPPAGHRFDRSKLLCDPYAKAMGGRDVWLGDPDWLNPYIHRSRLIFEDFDWEDDRRPGHPIGDLVIYEAHLRGFTRHPSSGVKAAGTYAGLREKIPYLRALGINCIELMPIFEFDEWENSRELPDGQRLVNYWGYSTLGFFAPKAGYAATGKYGMQADELKALVKDLHRAGIEVMLDVVFNHTGEGNERGPTISFRGIDNKTYYMLTPDGWYYNFSGTGNTLACNNPVVRSMVLDCLRYWAAEYHIDGFRFDLASILGRDVYGAPLSNPPLLETLAADPVLARCKLIAEAWDPGGLYQVGSFPSYGRWAEWNGRYRDDVRRFLIGEPGMAAAMAQRIQGSPDLYWARGTTASVNFVTCHDGFTLLDLFSYNGKHNEANGEDNNDGSNDNHSWNSGWEGPSTDPTVNALRARQVRNAFVVLLTSQGIPLILMGDEVGHSQGGNNNAYCQDNEISWFDWGLCERNADLLRFVTTMIAFRRAHPVLRTRIWFDRGQSDRDGEYPFLTFHGTEAWSADFSGASRTLAFMLEGRLENGARDAVYVAMNMYWEGLSYTLPEPLDGRRWHVVANTSLPSPHDIYDLGAEPLLEDQRRILMGARSVMVLVTR